MIVALHVLQTCAGGLWLVILCWLAPGFVRLLRGRGTSLDMRSLPTFLIAVTMVMGSLRWLIFPDNAYPPETAEMVTRMGTISLSLISGASILFIRHMLTRGPA